MNRRNNDGDVIANRISLLEAKGQKLLASLYGSRPDWDSADDSAAKAQDDDDDQDLKQNYAHDRIGLGGVLPKDIEDGSFTKRIPTSDDKLLQQLIGKKKAKAHIIAKQEAARPNAATKAKQHTKQSTAKKEDSDDEEGRAATFKSKRQRKERQAPKKVDSDDEDEESRAKRLATSAQSADETKEDVVAGAQVDEKPTQDDDDDDDVKVTEPASRRIKVKPKSFLDEILADRSKKKASKGR
ncbi:Proline iminopeptidase [Pyrenophora seminiperda CCB06]|uniref:Proline iminopeptidase n=1 Tax=Pyrenophora seminiperda CCB06 TaxID=1302712 RepID=A0A3M7MAQ8_9PLEO|nr:Proline iminopeptidase [Pyrenophora seminiperda CCB06]